jgi:hypothetical protein
MNLAGRWFAEITSKWIRRDTHRSVRGFTDSITHWVWTWNDDPRPYVWHKTADEIFDCSPFIANESRNQDTSRHFHIACAAAPLEQDLPRLVKDTN